MTPWPGQAPLGPPPVRWLLGVAAFVAVTVVNVLVVLVPDESVRVAALVAAPALALLGTALGVVLARRVPDARAVAVGLVWAAPVCVVATTIALLAG